MLNELLSKTHPLPVAGRLTPAKRRDRLSQEGNCLGANIVFI